MSPSTQKRMLLNLALLFVLATLVFFFYAKTGRQETAESLYDEAMGEEITSIVINKQDEKLSPDSGFHFELRKTGDTWSFSPPQQGMVDEQKVRHLFTLLFDPVSASYSALDKDLSKYGLAEESLSVSFNGVKILFGEENPISHHRYVKKRERIYLVAETVAGLLSSGMDAFTEKSAQ